MMIIKTIMLIIKTLNMMMIIIFRPGSPVCECNKGWGGDQCIQPLCNPPCRCPHNDDDDDDGNDDDNGDNDANPAFMQSTMQVSSQ